VGGGFILGGEVLLKGDAVKIVAVLGSPHGPKGATGTLLAEVIKGAEGAGAEVTALSLTHHQVLPCVGCEACHKTGKCGQKDGFGMIASAMMGAEGIIWASPNYIQSVSAQMKAVFDRCCGPLHCQAMLGKYAAAVETSGGPGGEEVQAYMLRYLRQLGCATVGSVGAMAEDMMDGERRAKVFKRAGELGAELVSAIKEKRGYPEQAAAGGRFLSG
jgi:multimeric flavodoxin WrbA